MPTFIDAEPITPVNSSLAAMAAFDQAAADLEADRIGDTLDAVFDRLEDVRGNLTPEEWADFGRRMRDEHELAGLVNQDPMTKRALDKPRGYAGDAVMMDYLYGIRHSLEADAHASPLGRKIFRHIQQRPAGESVRWRREHIAQLIDRIAADGSRPRVLAIASGHLREAELSEALANGNVGKFVALDADSDSLREVATNYAPIGVETVHGSVRHILARKLKLGTFDFVYAAGLYDYLPGNVAQALTARMFELTSPGGRMLIANFAPGVRDRAYMETFMDWRLIYRDEYDMAMLAAGLDPAEIESYDVYGDSSGSVVYLMVTKAESTKVVR